MFSVVFKTVFLKSHYTIMKEEITPDGQLLFSEVGYMPYPVKSISPLP